MLLHQNQSDVPEEPFCSWVPRNWVEHPLDLWNDRQNPNMPGRRALKLFSKVNEKSVVKLTLRIIDCINNLSCKSSCIRISVGHTLFDGLGFQMSIRDWLPISLRVTSCKIATCFSREWVGQEWRSWLEEKEDYNFDHNWFVSLTLIIVNFPNPPRHLMIMTSFKIKALYWPTISEMTAKHRDRDWLFHRDIK